MSADPIDSEVDAALSRTAMILRSSSGVRVGVDVANLAPVRCRRWPAPRAQNVAQMLFAAEAFSVDFVDVLGAGGPRGKPAAARGRLDAADRCIVPGDRSSTFSIFSPASSVLRTWVGDSFAGAAFWLAVAAASSEIGRGLAQVAHQVTIQFPGSRPLRAMISRRQQRPGAIPSLSVVHAVPSLRAKDARRSPRTPGPSDPSTRPATKNHLKPTGTS